MLTNKYLSYLRSNVLLLPFIWTFTGALCYVDGAKDLTSVTIFSLFLLFLTNKLTINPHLLLNTLKQSLFLILLLITNLYLISYNLIEHHSANYLRIYISLFLLFLFTSNKVFLTLEKNLPYIITLASIITFIFVLYNSIYLNLSRDLWEINAIPYSTVIGCLILLSINFFVFSKKQHMRYILATSIIINFISIILGETRGVWIALSISIIFFIIKIKKHLKLKKEFIIAISLIFICFSLLTAPLITERINQTNQELHNINSGNTNTSFGLRMNIWKTASYIIPNHFFFGVGDGKQEKEIRKTIINKYEMPYSTNNLGHYHNEIINLLVVYGFIGFILFFISFISPLFHLKSNKHSSLIVTIMLYFFICGLTDVPLRNYQPLIFYFIVMSILIMPNYKK